ncbi:MAG: DUF1127 domain-containing protein [Hyphomicrobiaceae bacterium]
MSTLTTTIGGGVRPADTTLGTARSVGTRLAMAIRELFNGHDANAELRALKDRDLADVGLTRNDLPVDLQDEIAVMQRTVEFHYVR